PAEEGRAEQRADEERAVAVEHSAEGAAHDARGGKRRREARADPARVPAGAPLAAAPPLVDGAFGAAAPERERTREADNSAADDRYAHRLVAAERVGLNLVFGEPGVEKRGL